MTEILTCKGNNDSNESPTTLMINENHKKRPLNVKSHSTSVEISDESIEVIDKCQNELEHQLINKKTPNENDLNYSNINAP